MSVPFIITIFGVNLQVYLQNLFNVKAKTGHQVFIYTYYCWAFLVS